MNVLIVESPSKAKSINKYLGSDFKDGFEPKNKRMKMKK